jgi:ATP-dependent Zn protease
MSTTAEVAATMPPPTIPDGPLLQQLAGMADARSWGEHLVRDLADHYSGRIVWSELEPYCVLHGPPGTGKTTFAKALAASAKLPLIATTFGEWQSAGEAHLGTLLKAMRSTFEHARSAAPCVLFIDELDSIPKRGAGERATTYWNQVTNDLLKLLDGLADARGVVVVGACNHLEMLDPALVRSGRLGRQLHVPLPGLDALPQILAFHLGSDTRRMGDLSSLAVLCIGKSGADIQQLVTAARRRARYARRPIARTDLLSEIESSVATLDEGTMRRIAVHEAGHAVVALRTGLSSDINLSIVHAGEKGAIYLDRTPRIQTRASIAATLTALLAGRAAEQVFFGEISGGAGGDGNSDLGRATRLALNAVCRLGLSSRETMCWLGQPEDTPLLAYPIAIQSEVAGLLSDAYQTAVKLIEQDWDFVDNTAAALMRRRALSHKEFVTVDRRPRSDRQ